MDTMDQQEIEFREKNEKNKTFRKRLRNFYIGLYAPWGVMLLLMGVFYSLESKTAKIAILWVVCGIVVAWFVWMIYGILYRMSCPHCKAALNKSDPWNIPKCPFCGTDLTIKEYYGREKL
jgi:uncharacterized protein with PQ loop repeat